MKPVVHYHSKLPRNHIQVGDRASIRLAEDHYAGCGMVGGESVHTSTVMAYDEVTGIFETRNTMYVPKLDK